MSNNGSSPLVLWYNQLGMNDVDRVGGKNASLGEMITNPFRNGCFRSEWFRHNRRRV